MRVQSGAAILLFIAFGISACQPAAQQTEADLAAIKDLAKAWNAGAEVGDIAALLALRTDDVVQYPPDQPTARGKQALNDFYTWLYGGFNVSGTLIEGSEEITVTDGWAYYITEYILRISPKAGGDTVEERGKIIIICERQPDGSWLWAHEMWNRNSPPPVME